MSLILQHIYDIHFHRTPEFYYQEYDKVILSQAERLVLPNIGWHIPDFRRPFTRIITFDSLVKTIDEHAKFFGFSHTRNLDEASDILLTNCIASTVLGHNYNPRDIGHITSMCIGNDPSSVVREALRAYCKWAIVHSSPWECNTNSYTHDLQIRLSCSSPLQPDYVSGRNMVWYKDNCLTAYEALKRLESVNAVHNA